MHGGGLAGLERFTIRDGRAGRTRSPARGVPVAGVGHRAGDGRAARRRRARRPAGAGARPRLAARRGDPRSAATGRSAAGRTGRRLGVRVRQRQLPRHRRHRRGRARRCAGRPRRRSVDDAVGRGAGVAAGACSAATAAGVRSTPTTPASSPTSCRSATSARSSTRRAPTSPPTSWRCSRAEGLAPEPAVPPRRRAGCCAEQERDGSWFGRWGANHVYGTGAVVPALVAAGVSPPTTGASSGPSPGCAAHQNDDGGWGEDLRSYDDPAWRARDVDRVADRVGAARAARRRARRLGGRVPRGRVAGRARSAPTAAGTSRSSPAPGSPATSTSTTTSTGWCSRSARSAGLRRGRRTGQCPDDGATGCVVSRRCGVEAPARVRGAGLPPAGVAGGCRRRGPADRRRSAGPSAPPGRPTARGSAVAVAGVAGGLRPGLRAGRRGGGDRGTRRGGRRSGARARAAAGRRAAPGRACRVHVGPVVEHRQLVDGAERRRLAATGALAVDMESAWLAGRRAGAPFARASAWSPTRPTQPLLRPVDARARALTALRDAAPRSAPVARRLGRRPSARAGCCSPRRARSAPGSSGPSTSSSGRSTSSAPRSTCAGRSCTTPTSSRDLEARGAVFVDELDEVPDGATVVFSAHGVSPAVRDRERAARPRRHRRHLPAGRQGAQRGAPLRRPRRHRAAHRPRRPRGDRGHPRRGARQHRPGARTSTTPTGSRAATRTGSPTSMQTTLAVDEAEADRRRPARALPDAAGARRPTTSATPPPTASAPCARSPPRPTWCSSSARRTRPTPTAWSRSPSGEGAPAHLVDDAGRHRPGAGSPVSAPSASPPAPPRPPSLVDDVVERLAGLGPVDRATNATSPTRTSSSPCPRRCGRR